MKKLRRPFLILISLLYLGITMQAQENPSVIPSDKKIRVGVLSNGLTYYIRQNDKPKNRVDFHIVQKVGSILEEPQQRGLAHFLEHMAFNGTRNFPGNNTTNGVISWGESKGLQFGSDINAGTGIDETIYDIMNVPADQKNVVDSCLLILHDWSHDLLLTNEEIDKERGVINEELRTKNTGMQRCLDQLAKQIYGESKYADCLPGGSSDVIEHFEYSTLRNYYKKWYRPDLQGIVVVGDVDPVRIESQIKEIFADIQPHKNPAKRIYYPVQKNTNPIVAIATDPEITDPVAFWSCKQDKFPKDNKNTIDYFAYDYISTMASRMMNDRLAAISNQPTAPFKEAHFSLSEFFLSRYAMDNLQVDFSFENDSALSAFQKVYMEVERVKRHGFTASEYERAKSAYIKQVQEEFSARNTVDNQVYAQKCIAHFTQQEPLTSVEEFYKYAQLITENLPLGVVNRWIQESITKENQVLSLIMPKKKGVLIPTEKQLKGVMKSVCKSKIAQIKEKFPIKELIKRKIIPGKIEKEISLQDIGVEKWTLSNGIEVYIKKTDFETNTIQFSAYREGGLFRFAPQDSLYAIEMSNVLSIATFSDHTKTELMRYLSDKMVDFKTTISLDEQNQKGQCKQKDIETLLQLTHLSFTDLRIDKDQFKSWQKQRKSQLELSVSEPQQIFSDSITQTMFAKYPVARKITSEQVDVLEAHYFEKIYREMMRNSAAFKFVFVGDISLERLRPLVEKYIASLPVFLDKDVFDRSRLEVKKGTNGNYFTVKQDENKSSVFMNFLTNSSYDLRNKLAIQIFSQVMNYRLYKKMREDEGGVYSPYIDASLMNKYYKMKRLLLVYDTDPDLVEKMRTIVNEDLKELATTGPSKENMKKALNYMQKAYRQSLKENDYWLGRIKTYLKDGLNEIINYENILKKITFKEIQTIAEQFSRTRNKMEIVMTTKK